MQHYTSSQNQQGAILFLALIMLLLITVIGTSSIGLTTLDTRMTSNARDRQSAFQTAEHGLLAAESILTPDKPLPIAGTTAGHIKGLTPEWWSTDPSIWNNGAAVPTTDNRVTTTYITSEPFEGAIDGGETVQDLSLDNKRQVKLLYYTSTSKGVGPGGAPALLQSVFARKTLGSELAE